MRATYEFRVEEKEFRRRFALERGRLIREGGSVRRLFVADDEDFLDALRSAYLDSRRPGQEIMFYGWDIRRTYTAEELASATLFCAVPRGWLDSSGKETGTVFDETTACPKCGAGALQVGRVHLPRRRVPARYDYLEGGEGERVVTERFARLWLEAGLGGARFEVPERDRGPVEDVASHRELVVEHVVFDIDAQTVTGFRPFDETRGGACPEGDTVGHARLSELFVRGSLPEGVDVAFTRQFIGSRGGSFRPKRELLVSPRAYRWAVTNKIRGLEFEVAHVV